MNQFAIDIKNLNVRQGKFELKDINFGVEKGTIMGFIGKNGAGKTTLIKAIMDVLQPLSGTVLFDGIPIYDNEEIVKSKIGVVYDCLIYPPNMCGKKLVRLLAPFYKDFDMELWGSLMARSELNENARISSFSKGMQMKFSIIMALAQKPEILILDEPTAGLDPTARVEVLELLQEFIQDENKSILFSTNITSDLDKIADEITLIDNGKIIFSEEKEKLLDMYAVVRVDKESMTDSMKQGLSGLRENSFGFEGMCSDKTLYQNNLGVKIARPTVEDIMVFKGGLELD